MASNWGLQDKTQVVCCIKPSGESLKKCFFIGQWNFGTFCYSNYDKSQDDLPLKAALELRYWLDRLYFSYCKPGKTSDRNIEAEQNLTRV